MEDDIYFFTASGVILADAFGGKYPDAYIGLREYSTTIQKSKQTTTFKDGYDHQIEVQGAAYSVSFWYSEETFKNGEPSRPLMRKDPETGKLTDVFVVDISAVEVKAIMSSGGDSDTKDNRVVRSDFVRRFS